MCVSVLHVCICIWSVCVHICIYICLSLCLCVCMWVWACLERLCLIEAYKYLKRCEPRIIKIPALYTVEVRKEPLPDFAFHWNVLYSNENSLFFFHPFTPVCWSIIRCCCLVFDMPINPFSSLLFSFVLRSDLSFINLVASHDKNQSKSKPACCFHGNDYGSPPYNVP